MMNKKSLREKGKRKPRRGRKRKEKQMGRKKTKMLMRIIKAKKSPIT